MCPPSLTWRREETKFPKRSCFLIIQNSGTMDEVHTNTVKLSLLELFQESSAGELCFCSYRTQTSIITHKGSSCTSWSTMKGKVIRTNSSFWKGWALHSISCHRIRNLLTPSEGRILQTQQRTHERLTCLLNGGRALDEDTAKLHFAELWKQCRW
jgi:hypothetical protein